MVVVLAEGCKTSGPAQMKPEIKVNVKLLLALYLGKVY